ncbi:CapA family protein [Streptomyces ipomoeae]|uniref:Bacterial capsule synthesis protein n=3 Tax=Streptomyces ipomoeae TaxID=103232 RepID=L1L1K0_9ACTN|nr:CapA family protein [Streptomyces ipomoeae]EKX66493.1 bacterial capsule synthesis protein [Streptomyces ipomoeae 91-03]MDX2822258.1 CapA family protein [Streptomyces ipomoeae]MDX2840600.1 CapA family protein [Streptomyces ipomoeae]MDX2874775.1 CapA family protein [Streptomyces ipomoeae]TQE35345.1 CapA family protein [Streptomyces ipomoeae]
MRARTRSTGIGLAALLLSPAIGCQAQDSATPPTLSGHPTPSSPAKHSRGFTLVASGDVLPHMSIIEKARQDAGGGGYDFRPMLAGVKSVVAGADLAICHMETVYGADGNYSGYPTFKSPPQVAEGLAVTGYDGCSTASNHTLDDGAAGIHRTLDALDRAGVRHAGSARTAQEAGSPTLMRAGGAQLAHLAYTYGTNGIPLPADRPWVVNLIDRERILADARTARKAGADVVVVSLHWGTEWQDAPDAQQLSLGEQLTSAATDGRPDIDLILGTHAHVPQAYEKVNGTWVVYGMGDQIAGAMINHSGAHDPRGNQGTLARFTFAPPTREGARWEVTRAEFVPQWFDVGSGRVVNLNAVIESGTGTAVADVTAVRDRIRDVVLSRGAAQDGLAMGR